MKTIISLYLLALGTFSLAATLTVSNTLDSGPGSLRDQINASSSGDIIVFDAAVYGDTIKLTSGSISINHSLEIIGFHKDSIIISGEHNSRIFDVSDYFEIHNVSLVNGQTTGNGGAIYSFGASSFYIHNSRFEDNSAGVAGTGDGGAIYINACGYFYMDSTIFITNDAEGHAGAIYLDDAVYEASFDQCWFDANSAITDHGALYIRTVYFSASNSTFNHNSAPTISILEMEPQSGQPGYYGLTNCTFSTNTTMSSGASIYINGLNGGSPELSMINCTYTDNNRPIAVEGSATLGNAELNLRNSIFNNSGDNIINYATCTYSSLGGNISNDNTMNAFLIGTNDQNNTNPMLGPLSNNGGLMVTHTLLTGSPAIENGVIAYPYTDQVGKLRSGNHDAGSMEFCFPDAGTDIQTACGSFTWIDGNTYTNSNSSATYSLKNIYGCDSIVTLDLTINAVDTNVMQNGFTLSANASGASYQWVDCDNGFAAIPGETSQNFTASTNGNYALVVTENGCSDTSSCYSITGIGIEEAKQNMVYIYPNPSSEILNISWDSDDVIELAKIYSLDGKLVAQYNNSNSKLVLDVSSFTPGVYTVQLHFKEHIHVARISVR